MSYEFIMFKFNIFQVGYLNQASSHKYFDHVFLTYYFYTLGQCKTKKWLYLFLFIVKRRYILLAS